jgi:hypothetical protein
MDAAPTCPRKTALSVKNAIWLYCITLLKKTQAVYQKTQYRTSFFYFVHNVLGWARAQRWANALWWVQKIHPAPAFSFRHGYAVPPSSRRKASAAAQRPWPPPRGGCLQSRLGELTQKPEADQSMARIHGSPERGAGTAQP